jgi:hypothetical protein
MPDLGYFPYRLQRYALGAGYMKIRTDRDIAWAKRCNELNNKKEVEKPKEHFLLAEHKILKKVLDND